jgi:cytosine/adenosine deaminase-related metal-dependent hydrolase
MLAHALEMREVANELGVRILTHVFRGSLQWAAKNFGSAIQTILGTDVMLAHANGLTADEVDIVARSGCSVICAPSTEENVMYGVCPVTSLIERGVPVAICSDGNAPRYSMDLWKDLYRCMFHQWVSNSDLDVLPAGRALRMVTIEAARVIGLDNEIGSLEEGKCADIIAVDLSQPHLTPQVALPNLLAYYVGGHDVDTVIVGGRVIMRERTIETADVKEVVKRARVEAAAAFARVPVNDYLVFDQTYWNGSRYPRTPLA